MEEQGGGKREQGGEKRVDRSTVRSGVALRASSTKALNPTRMDLQRFPTIAYRHAVRTNALGNALREPIHTTHMLGQVRKEDRPHRTLPRATPFGKHAGATPGRRERPANDEEQLDQTNSRTLLANR